MKQLEDAIVEKGRVYPGNILKVDSFLNHQIDVDLVEEIAQVFYNKYKDSKVTKIFTIEASGIAIAYATARYFGVPVLFAKKSQGLNLGNEVYVSRISSYTYAKDYDVTVSRQFLNNTDRVLIVDDFVAIGNAAKGLLEICEQAHATVAGIGICIEKAFQHGGDDLRRMGYDVTSLAIIDSMSEDGTITFKH